jgi:hypothetical protein
MKYGLYSLSLTLGRLNQRHIRLMLVVLSLALFVLGAGAPADFGGH